MRFELITLACILAASTNAAKLGDYVESTTMKKAKCANNGPCMRAFWACSADKACKAIVTWDMDKHTSTIKALCGKGKSACKKNAKMTYRE